VLPVLHKAGYSPLLELPGGTVLNAPHVAVARPNGALALHPKVVMVSPDKSSVVLRLTQGFSQGQPIVYISTGEVQNTAGLSAAAAGGAAGAGACCLVTCGRLH
jgi:hypothetical protein